MDIFIIPDDTDEQALKERVMKYVKPEMLHLMTLMPLLRNCDLLTVADEDDLMNRQVPPAERANKFVYHILPSKGPRGYRLFIKCLQEEKEHHGHQELVRLLTTPQGEDTSHRNLSTLPPQCKLFWYHAYMCIYSYSCCIESTIYTC